jgi:DsbC/DsbD-like thiol-disulfide interchange protein
MKHFIHHFAGKSAIFALLIISICAINISAQDEPDPAKWTLNVETQEKKPARDDNFTALLSVEIEKGWHLYALEKIDGGPIPTRITLAENQPFELGKIEFAPPIGIDDAMFGVVTKFYEDSAKFKLPLRVLQNLETNKIQVKIRYQICNDEICLPPKSTLVEANF